MEDKSPRQFKDEFYSLKQEKESKEQELESLTNQLNVIQGKITSSDNQIKSLEKQKEKPNGNQGGNAETTVSDFKDTAIKNIDNQINKLKEKLEIFKEQKIKIENKIIDIKNLINQIITKIRNLIPSIDAAANNSKKLEGHWRSVADKIDSQDSTKPKELVSKSPDIYRQEFNEYQSVKKEIITYLNSEKNINTISKDNFSTYGSYEIKPKISKPFFNDIPNITYSKNKAEINKAIMNVKGNSIDNLLSSKTDNSGINKLIEELNSPGFIERSLRLYGNQVKDNTKGKNWAEEYYFYKKYKNTTTFNPYYEPYTKSILSNQYRKYDYK